MPDGEPKDIGAIAKQAVDKYRADRAHLSRVTLSNGIILDILTVPEEPIRRAVLAYELPEVPIAKLGDLEIEEENPEDPDYQEALLVAMANRMGAGYRAATILGTECKKAPSGYKPKDEKWIARLKVAGVEVDTSSEHTRYADWLYLHALADPMDQALVCQTVLMFSYVEVAELSQAILWFRNRGRRDATDGSDTSGDADIDGGDVPGGDAGVGEPDGGEGDGPRVADPVDDVDGDVPQGQSGDAGVAEGKKTRRASRDRKSPGAKGGSR